MEKVLVTVVEEVLDVIRWWRRCWVLCAGYGGGGGAGCYVLDIVVEEVLDTRFSCKIKYCKGL